MKLRLPMRDSVLSQLSELGPIPGPEDPSASTLLAPTADRRRLPPPAVLAPTRPELRLPGIDLDLWIQTCPCPDPRLPSLVLRAGKAEKHRPGAGNLQGDNSIKLASKPRLSLARTFLLAELKELPGLAR